jgi:very-short-patch-repair endonuclease
MGVEYEREVIAWFNGDRFVLSDFWLPGYRLTIELDGIQHRGEVERDAEKAQVIYQATGFRTHQVWNSWAIKPGLETRLIALLSAASS